MSTHPSYVVRVPPQPGQSLSSWRQDAALANGYDLYPVPAGALRRVDPDAGGNPAELEWLATTHSISLQEVESLTLRSFEGKIFRQARLRSHPAWLLRTRYTRGWLVPGPLYCPHCLAHSGGAYFRLTWRLGFITHCPIHHCEMLDRCPACGAGVWPVGATVPKLFEVDIPTDYLRCARCGFQLSGASADPVPEGQDAAQWETALLNGMPQWIAKDCSVESMEYLQGLDAICHLFLRNRPRRRILSGPSVWAVAAEGLTLESGINQVELLGVEDRRSLVGVARPLLRDWPDAFVEFAKQTGLSQEHFSGAGHLMPDWMRLAVHEKLRRQIRVSVEAVSAEIATMQSAGLKVTKQALRERLGGNAKAIGVLLPCRQKATRLERNRIVTKLIGKRRRRLRRQTVSLVRNQLHLMLAVLSGNDLGAVSSMTASEVQDLVERTRGTATFADRRLAEGASEHWQRLAARASGWGNPSFPFRTSKDTDALRFVRRTLVEAMSPMKLDLRRDVSVFWSRGR